ncbi:MAG: hypothetical protein ACRETW_09430 [Stenotrophobium sp.]
MLKKRLIELALAAVFLTLLWGGRNLAMAAAAQESATPAHAQMQSAPAATSASQQQGSGSPGSASGAGFDFFSDKPVQGTQVVELPPPKSKWATVGGPLALVAFFFLMNLIVWWLIPFSSHSVDINLRDLPPAARRGIAMATAFFGVAFCFGATEIWYQLQLNGSAEAFFAQMSLGKIIIMTHAHLFGFTTAFFIVGIPFSLQFPHIKAYQWVFPVGLSASLTDVISWWGIKYVAGSFEYVSMFCGVLFTISYMWMLIGLLRVLLFPDVIWASDKDSNERRMKLKEKQMAGRDRPKA